MRKRKTSFVLFFCITALVMSPDDLFSFSILKQGLNNIYLGGMIPSLGLQFIPAKKRYFFFKSLHQAHRWQFFHFLSIFHTHFWGMHLVGLKCHNMLKKDTALISKQSNLFPCLSFEKWHFLQKKEAAYSESNHCSDLDQ